MIRPSAELAVAINRAVRDDDEWFDEPDDLDRLRNALDAIAEVEDVATAAAVLMYRVTRAQAFGEGNSARRSYSAGGCSTGTARTGIDWSPLMTGDSSIFS